MSRKWGNRFILNNDFSYIDFLQSIDGNVADGLWTIELLKVLKSYDFRYVVWGRLFLRCVYCTTNVNPSARQYDYLDFYRVRVSVMSHE